MIPVVIFTFADDAPAAMLAAQAATAAGLGRVYLEVDAAKPFPAALAKEAIAKGYHYRLTSFPRERNLLGIECYQGMLASYDFVLRDTGASYVLKLDSDTIILRAARIFNAVRAGVALAGWSQPKYHFYGCCSVISRRLVDFIRADIQQGGRLPHGYQPYDMPEDLVTGSYGDIASVGEVRRWLYDPRGGFCAGWRYSEATISLDEYARRFDVIIFGNRHLLPGKECSKRDQVAATMLEFVTGRSLGEDRPA